MGSATLYHLTHRGKRVLGLEQFSRGHELGSSHGDSRIIREQYFEHPLYVPLVQRAYTLWRELEAQIGQSLMRITGGLMIGPPDGVVVTGALRSANEYGLAHVVLTSSEIHTQFPAFQPDSDLIGVLDPHAGYLDPNACCSAHLDLAIRAGAETRFRERVLRWSASSGGVRVDTSSGSYLADHLLISAGGWTTGIMDDLKLPLTVERQVAFWLDTRGTEYDAERFPIYAYEYKPGSICYGFPRLARGVKASVMHDGETSRTPSTVRRTVDEGEIEALRAALRPVLPELAKAPVLDSNVCLFTNTPDHDFIIDFHPLHPQVLVSSPCSGHGFKFASALGELQADLLITGTTRFDISAFSIVRFAE
jgi:sarcosine oxidase